MQIIPTMELLGGVPVSLVRGNLDMPSRYHVDPIETARGWAAAGAEWMHLTDFDAIEGRDTNAELVEQIIREVGIPVQLGGGIRTAEAAESWIDKGAGRIVIGTLATQSPDAVQALAKRFPDQIVLAIDVWRGQLMRDGWRTGAALQPDALIEAFNATPLAAMLITDIDSDIEDTEAQLGVISGLADLAKAPVIASGVLRAPDDVARLKYVPHVSGALLGRALFTKTIDLDEALLVARPAPEAVADFI
ncbi:MAG: 1-(5-phosphoribosyl)-5-[(5-phosphoribosylamino)methylideneamino] imidazole-4-carboxamide isomerase [Rhodobacteraceae bacterium]|nr:1-(5-phosphoribosyl)-5-[(5-phosphoribosylamino)methylideneamino] imidazole-4-carboxamide isomerase [Paracoccaceae bacterium]